MKATVATSITIAADPAIVFGYLTDLKYHYLWNPQVRSISTTECLKLNSQFTTTSEVLGIKINAENIVTEFKPFHKLVIENSLGNVKYRAIFLLNKKDGNTYAKLSIVLEADNRFRIFTVPILKQLALRELRTDLQALKVAVENRLE